MTPSQLAAIAQPLEKLFYETQQRIMSDVVRRIKKTGDITSTADYQLNKYLILGGTTEMIESEIQRLTQKSYAEMFELYDRVINSDYVRYKDVYEQINGNFPTIADPENEILNSWITGIVLQTHAAIKNISQSMGFTVDSGHGPVFTPLADVYQKYVDATCMDVVTGSFDYNTVLRRTARQMSRSGLQVVDYASGHVNRAPVAVRRAVMAGVNQVSAKINEKVAKDLNTDYFEVTAHSGARPSHMTWQGKVYSYSDLVSVCGLGDVTGLCGANCRHAYYAFIPEVSVRAYTDEELARMQQEDEKEIYWQGKPYNGYQRTQKARQYETAMRAQRSEIKTLKDGGADPADLEAAQIKYLSTMNEYKAFCADMSLRPQMNRVYIDGLGRMSGGRIPNISFTSSAKPNIIKLKDIYIHRSLGAKARNYEVLDLETGYVYNFTEGRSLYDVKVFAGKGTSKEYRRAYVYAEKWNNDPAEWQHVKGKGYIDTINGSELVEVHWSQCEGIKDDFFIKKWLEE